MKVVVITSCTGEKAVDHPAALTMKDFQGGAEVVQAREAKVAEALRPAEEIYTGQQHVRLMRGIRAAREKGDLEVELHILSAGYGLISADRQVAPYECTFAGMRKKELRAWADELNVPADVRGVVHQPYDLGLVLLGDSYLEAIDLKGDISWGGPTLVYCGKRSARRLKAHPNLQIITLTNKEAKRFSCGLVALKGELAARILEGMSENKNFVQPLLDKGEEKLGILDRPEDGPNRPRPNPNVQGIISIPETWWEQPHRCELRYFIPEWDDLVDPDYNYLDDAHWGWVGNWNNEAYAHQLYPTPNYDGILISKVVAEKSKAKKKRINKLGVHKYLRVPDRFPVMGDCGAFDYIKEDEPPYTTDEILDYYSRLGFNYGVSIDHLIVKATEDQKQFRFGLTIQNAEDFILEHKRRGLSWEPIGAVQGWDPASYAEAARQIAAMGYKYLGLGGLVRTKTDVIGHIVESVRSVIPADVRLHLFGIARLQGMRRFADLGVASVDSASALRRAWLGSNDNYWTLHGDQYAAIRIPEAGKSFRAKRMVSEGRASKDEVERLEHACLRAVRGYARHEVSLEDAVEALDNFDHLITPDRSSMRDAYEAVLAARPWESCPCEICQRDGVEVIIFRGNNRNRRRGFHNTWVFYRLFKQALEGHTITLKKVRKLEEKVQMELFS